MSAVSIALTLIFFAIAGLHLYWGVGGTWPGIDSESLRLRVVGTRGRPMFGLMPCAAVAAALAAAAAVVFAGHSDLVSGGFAWIVFAGYAVLILVFGLRGLAAYIGRAYDYARGTPFFSLNRRYYGPLCLIVAAGLIVDFPPGLDRVLPIGGR